ncbi:hypothetical protein NMS60_003538, partial [Vibrio cholerae]|nr:hypothetical protein [Vibrio cholerae]
MQLSCTCVVSWS